MREINNCIRNYPVRVQLSNRLINILLFRKCRLFVCITCIHVIHVFINFRFVLQSSQLRNNKIKSKSLQSVQRRIAFRFRLQSDRKFAQHLSVGMRRHSYPAGCFGNESDDLGRVGT